LERHRNDVENIRTNISNKEDILFQIKKTQDKNDEVNREIMELNKKSDQQKRENEQLQRKLENLRIRQKTQSQAAAVAAMTKIKDLEAKIQESEKQMKNLNKPQVTIQTDLKTPQQKLSKTLPISTTAKSNTSFVKVMDEIEEIKSILMVSINIVIVG
jgi:predicted RNase H-like nuclease (RuvC/YqgF family)